MNELEKAQFIIDIQEFKKTSVMVGYVNHQINQDPSDTILQKQYEDLKLKQETMHENLIEKIKQIK